MVGFFVGRSGSGRRGSIARLGSGRRRAAAVDKASAQGAAEAGLLHTGKRSQRAVRKGGRLSADAPRACGLKVDMLVAGGRAPVVARAKYDSDLVQTALLATRQKEPRSKVHYRRRSRGGGVPGADPRLGPGGSEGGAAILEQGWVNVQRGKVRSHDSNTFGGRGECIARAPRRSARTPRGLHAETTQGPAWSTQTQRRAWVSVLRQGGLCVPLVVSRARRGCARQHPCSLATAKAPWPDLGGWEGSP